MSNRMRRDERRALVAKLSHRQRAELRKKVGKIRHFTDGFIGVHLRPYQLEAANAIVNSVLNRDGNTFVIIFARQSGKDELLADLILFIMGRLAEIGCSIVCTQPPSVLKPSMPWIACGRAPPRGPSLCRAISTRDMAICINC